MPSLFQCYAISTSCTTDSKDTTKKLLCTKTAKTMAERYHELATFLEIKNRCHYMQLEMGWEEKVKGRLTCLILGVI